MYIRAQTTAAPRRHRQHNTPLTSDSGFYRCSHLFLRVEHFLLLLLYGCAFGWSKRRRSCSQSCSREIYRSHRCHLFLAKSMLTTEHPESRRNVAGRFCFIPIDNHPTLVISPNTCNNGLARSILMPHMAPWTSRTSFILVTMWCRSWAKWGPTSKRCGTGGGFVHRSGAAQALQRRRS